MDADGGHPTQYTANLDRDNYPDWQPLAANSATVTVRNAERPATAGGHASTSRSAPPSSGPPRATATRAPTRVSPGVYLVSEAAGRRDVARRLRELDPAAPRTDVPTSAGPGARIDVAVACGDTEVCTVANTHGAPTPAGSASPRRPPDVTTGAPGDDHVRVRRQRRRHDAELVGQRARSPAGFDVDGAYYDLEPPRRSPPRGVLLLRGDPAVDRALGRPASRSTPARHRQHGLQRGVVVLPVRARAAEGDDTEAPHVTCGTADGAWHADNVAVACTAEDAGSGLADAATRVLADDLRAGGRRERRRGHRHTAGVRPRGQLRDDRPDRRPQDRPTGADTHAAERQVRRRDLAAGRDDHVLRLGGRRR